MKNKIPDKLQKTIKFRVLQDDITQMVYETTELYRKCVGFCLSVVKENTGIMEVKDLHRQQVQVEKLIHATYSNPTPVYNIEQVGKNIPAYFRRSFINTALGIANSWYSNYKRWLNGCKKKKPPALRVENKQWPVYFKGVYKNFTNGTVMLKLYTGHSWVWRKVRIATTQGIPNGCRELSLKLLIKNGRVYIHRTIERKRRKLGQIHDRVVSVDLNIDRAAVMAVIGRDGRVHKTKFIDIRKDNRRRKFYLETITMKQSITKSISEGQTFCKELWDKVRHFNDNLSHQLSRKVVDFAQDNNCSVIVFEHLWKLRPEKGSKSRYLNSKLMYWLKGDIYKKTAYKANWGGIWTTRVNPKNTSKLCSRHHDIFNYHETEGTTRPIQSRFKCKVCGYELDADLNACINIARKYFSRESQIKALDGDIQAWSKAIRFLSGCMNPLYSGLDKLGTAGGEDYVPISAPYPYPRQVKVP